MNTEVRADGFTWVQHHKDPEHWSRLPTEPLYRRFFYQDGTEGFANRKTGEVRHECQIQ